jgi:hypothetical protein
MNQVTAFLTSRPRLAGILTVVLALVVAACKSGGGSSGY